MRFDTILLLDHDADLGGVADIDELCARAHDYVDERITPPPDGWIDLEWVASEALDVVVAYNDDHPPLTWADARSEFLSDSPFATTQLGIEPSAAARRSRLWRVLTELEKTSGDISMNDLANRLRTCADWIETGLPGVAPEGPIDPRSCLNYDMRDPRKARRPWVLIKVQTKG